MNARRSMYLEIYGTRTPTYPVRPTSGLRGAVVGLAVVGLTVLVMAPEVYTWAAELASGALSSLR